MDKQEKAEEPKYSDRNVEINGTKQSYYNENKIENHNVDIENKNCMKCEKHVETGVQCRYCQRWF